jgi:hypothetical protein
MIWKVYAVLLVVSVASFAVKIEIHGIPLENVEPVSESADSVYFKGNNGLVALAKSDITSVDGVKYTGQSIVKNPDSSASASRKDTPCKETTELKNRLTIINGTNERVFVKIKSVVTGAVVATCTIHVDDSCTVKLPNGSFVDYVRHGNKPGKYHYSKGEGFSACPDENGYEVMSMTIHGVVYGHYRSEDCSAKEFGE